MRAVLSHPYCGALYWWFTDLQGHALAKEDPPNNAYYRAVFGDARRNIEIALAFAVIFEDLLVPAVDAPFGDSPGFSGEARVAELGMVATWETSRRAQELTQLWHEDILADVQVRAVLARLPEHGPARQLEIHYAIVDILLAADNDAPIICGAGRGDLIVRLLDLGYLDAEIASAVEAPALLPGGRAFEEYVDLVGLTFVRTDLQRLGEVKDNEKIRCYARSFQDVLLGVGSADGSGLFDAIEQAWDSAEGQADLERIFSAHSRTFAVVGLVPGAGLLTGPLSLAADGASVAARRRHDRRTWYELGPEIEKFQSMQALRARLDHRRDEP